MNKDYLVLGGIGLISVLLLLLFVKKHQMREALFAFVVAQLFSWPLTLLYVQFGLQTSPVRLFPHATEGNFIFSFFFHPAVFVVFYLHYPKRARKSLRLLYIVLITPVSILALYITSVYTSLIFFPHPSVLIASYAIITACYIVSSKYLNWYFGKLCLYKRRDI